MAGEALFVGWGQVVRGREQLALEVFQETVAFWNDHHQAGRIAAFEPVLLAPHGGDIAGYFLVRGERTALDEIRASDAFLRVVARASAVVDNFGVVPAHTSDGVAQLLGIFGEVSQTLPQR